MKTIRWLTVAVSTALTATAMAETPTVVNIQGVLTDSAGAPVADSNYTVELGIYDVPAGGTALWTESQPVTTSGGLFTTLLGVSQPLVDTIFADSARWLGVTLSPGPELSPRQRLAAVMYALRVYSVDGATGGRIRSKVAIGTGHDNSGADAFVAGADNTATGDQSAVTGGSDNEATGTGAFVGGGRFNKARGPYSVVAGGGLGNEADSNLASAQNTVVSGGRHNIAEADIATVGGGGGNLASGAASTVGGGASNSASGSRSTVGGGALNVAAATRAAIAGGEGDTALGVYSSIAGGLHNRTVGPYSLVAGGRDNIASDSFCVVLGGDGNAALTRFGVVAGGRGNAASAPYTFAAGRRAKAFHGGSFVWADSSDADFATTGPSQFLIRASGVGIGTTSPSASLDVAGSLEVGGGTPVTRIISSAGTLDFPPIGPNTASDLTLAAPGAEEGDVVSLGLTPVTVMPNTTFLAWVSSSDVVTIRCLNNDAAASVDPPSRPFRVMIVKF